MTGVLGAIEEGMRRAGVDFAPLGLAWARALPVVTIVPAFGLQALPGPARPAIALALAAAIYPSLAPVAREPAAPWACQAVLEAARGLPVAVAAAVPLWAATMAGGLADALRGAQDSASMPAVEERTTPLAIAMSLLASAFFLASGGPAGVALALAEHPGGSGALARTADALVSGIALAVGVGSPLLAASVVIELAAALVHRATSPTQVQAMVAPLRTVALLGVFALLLDRMVRALGAAL